MNDHSCYFLKHNTLVYRHVSGRKKRALAFQESGKHAYFYHSATPFAHMTPRVAQPLESVSLPCHGRPETSPAWDQRQAWSGRTEARLRWTDDLEEAREELRNQGCIPTGEALPQGRPREADAHWAKRSA